jgi:hypothetical protein
VTRLDLYNKRMVLLAFPWVIAAGAASARAQQRGTPPAPLPSHRPAARGDGPMRGRRRRGFAGPVMGMPGCRLLSSTRKDPGWIKRIGVRTKRCLFTVSGRERISDDSKLMTVDRLIVAVFTGVQGGHSSAHVSFSMRCAVVEGCFRKMRLLQQASECSDRSRTGVFR